MPLLRFTGLIIAIILCQICSGNASATERHSVLVIDYPPYQSPTLPMNGISGEIMTGVFDAVDMEYKFEYVPLKRAVYNIVNGLSHLYIGNLNFFKKENRDQLLLVPFINIRMVFFYSRERHAKGIEFSKLSDLKPYDITILTGGFIRQSLTDNGLSFHEVSSTDALFSMIKHGRTDLSAALDLAGIDLIKRKYPEEIGKFAYTASPASELPAGLVISKQMEGYEEFAEKFRLGLSIIKNNGVYKNILTKYYGGEKTPGSIMKNTPSVNF